MSVLTRAALSRTADRPAPGPSGPRVPSPSPPTLSTAPTTVRPEPARETDTRFRFRWSIRQVALLGVVLAALGVLAYQYRDGIDLAVWRDGLNPGWAVLAAAGALMMQVGNVWNLTGASPVPLRFRRTLGVQFAGTLARLISPSAVGGAAVNAQYLRRSGSGNVAAVGAVSVAQAVQLASAIIMFPLVAGFTSYNLGFGFGTPLIWGIVAGVAVVLVGVGVLLARRFPLIEAKLRFGLRELTKSLRTMTKDPAKAALSLLGAAVISAGLIGALWASVHAFGGDLSLGLAACVLVVGTTAGNAVPVPGGIGTVEAALVAALGAIGGVPVAVALPAVALFRLVTLWLQIPVGLFCAAALRRGGAL